MITTMDTNKLISEKSLNLEEFQLTPSPDLNYWHCLIKDESGFPISGGFGRNKLESRKIAISEYLERTSYYTIAKSGPGIRDSWGLNIIPTACGFAAGFNQYNTIVRSIGEAAERWVMSKWIDDKLFIPELDEKKMLHILDPVSKWLCDQFDSIRFFKKQVQIYFGRHILLYNIGLTICYSRDGVFPGSSFQYSDNDIWQHALLESFRHLLFTRNSRPINHFPYNKITYFSQNAELGTMQIEAAKGMRWPKPNIKFFRSEKYHNPNYFLVRTILDGWSAWNEGPLQRFLY